MENNIKEFKELVINSYPQIGRFKSLTKREQQLMLAGKLAGEAGEVIDEVGKYIWYGDYTEEEHKERFKGELADVLYMLIATADHSGITIDGQPPKFWKWTSTVHKNKKPIGRECPSYKQDGECGSCRACWNHKVKQVSYKEH